MTKYKVAPRFLYELEDEEFEEIDAESPEEAAQNYCLKLVREDTMWARDLSCGARIVVKGGITKEYLVRLQFVEKFTIEEILQ